MLARVLLYFPVIAYLCLFVAAVTVSYELGHWPRSSIDDPKQVLSAHPWILVAAELSGIFLAANMLCPIVPVLGISLFLRAKRTPHSVGLGLCLVTTTLSAFDPGGLLFWIFD